ncbi:MAG TPA: permease prefix domain 1-containing protein [Blastocatellia bacterium]|nr:permease prefix domain 1-containing protein [Blastocatellia bacterium]
MFDRFRLRLSAIFRKTELDRELDEELRYHLEQEIERNIAGGMSPREARATALREFGGLEQKKEECRDAHGMRVIEEARQDLHYGLRVLWRSPGWTAVLGTTLALGIGLTTAIFSLAYGILQHRLPYPAPERLAALYLTNTTAAAAGLGPTRRAGRIDPVITLRTE